MRGSISMPRHFVWHLALFIGLLAVSVVGQPPLGMMASGAQVKISAQPFHVANTQHLGQIIWTTLGRTARENIYCVSEAPVSQLRFVCTDCLQRNITDIVEVLNSAQDLTRTAGFPTIQLQNVEANPAWTGATIMCQAALNGGFIDSSPAVVDVRYMRGVHVVDAAGQGPVFISNQGYHFYVECTRTIDGRCQSAQRRKTLHCAVQAHPPATSYRWLKNGGPISGNGPEITVGTEMIGHSLQCSANNGLYGDDMPTSQAVFIDPYSAARLLQTNFAEQRKQFYEMNQRLSLRCLVEGNPRPVVFWKLRRPNGQVVDALCPQGLTGQYQEIPPAQQAQYGVSVGNQIVLNAICDLQILNYAYSGTYWCSACSYVSQGQPECAPGVEAPGEQVVDVQVQGPPQVDADQSPTVVQFVGESRAQVAVHYCADPAPVLPRDAVFSVDDHDIQFPQTWENFRFIAHDANNTLANCFVAVLQIAPVRDDDPSRQIILKVSNSIGSKQIRVSLADLLGESGAELSGMPGWLLVLLTVSAAVLVLATVLILCMRSQMLCFDQVKDPQSQYSTDKLKSGAHDTYADDASRGGLFGGTSSPSAGVSPPAMSHSTATGSINSHHIGVLPPMTINNTNGGVYAAAGDGEIRRTTADFGPVVAWLAPERSAESAKRARRDRVARCFQLSVDVQAPASLRTNPYDLAVTAAYSESRISSV